MKQILENRKDIAFFIKMFPLMKIHPDAYRKSKTIVCEKSLKLLDDAFKKKALPEPTCDTTIIDDNIKLAGSLGITGAPTIILPDGRIISGFVKADALIDKIDGINNQ